MRDLVQTLGNPPRNKLFTSPEGYYFRLSWDDSYRFHSGLVVNFVHNPDLSSNRPELEWFAGNLPDGPPLQGRSIIANINDFVQDYIANAISEWVPYGQSLKIIKHLNDKWDDYYPDYIREADDYWIVLVIEVSNCRGMNELRDQYIKAHEKLRTALNQRAHENKAIILYVIIVSSQGLISSTRLSTRLCQELIFRRNIIDEIVSVIRSEAKI